jgi:hypothetical protein
MRDAPTAPPRAEEPLALQALALRYAAGDLPPGEVEAFEVRLATEQAARDALAEAVRLSAAALGQAPPSPDQSFRAMIRERLSGRWLPGWLARRAYRGHPAAWFVVGMAAAVVAVVWVDTAPDERGTLSELTSRPSDPPPAEPTTPHDAPPGIEAVPALQPEPGTVAACGEGVDDPMARAAELWAEMSTPETVEKAVEEEARWKQRLRDLQFTHPGRPAASIDVRDP